MSSNVGIMLSWVQPEPGKRHFELRDGDGTLASLDWKSAGSADAEGMAGVRRISFIRKGFFFHYTTIIDAETGSEIAVFRFHGGDKGDLTYSDGYKLRWKFEGILEPRWYITTEKGGELLCFSVPPAKKSAGARTAAVIEVLRDIDEGSLTLLAVIGWYNLYNILLSRL